MAPFGTGDGDVVGKVKEEVIVKGEVEKKPDEKTENISPGETEKNKSEDCEEFDKEAFFAHLMEDFKKIQDEVNKPLLDDIRKMNEKLRENT